MATPVERVEATIEALLNKQVDVAVQLRIVERFVTHWQSEFDGLVADPEAPTNTEKAAFFLKKMADFGRDIVRAEAKDEARSTTVDTINEAGDTAAADLE